MVMTHPIIPECHLSHNMRRKIKIRIDKLLQGLPITPEDGRIISLFTYDLNITNNVYRFIQ